MRYIYLLRHGETDWNREERLQGTLDVPINSAGVQQTRQLAPQLKNLKLSRIFTSPLLRARQTAAIISANRSCQPCLHDDLREIDHGAWAGMTMKSIERSYPGQFAVWRHEPDRLRLDRAEGLQHAYARVSRFLSILLKSGLDGDVLVVGHGVTNSLILCAAAGTTIRDVGKFSQPNGWVAELRARGRTIVSMEGLKG